MGKYDFLYALNENLLVVADYRDDDDYRKNFTARDEFDITEAIKQNLIDLNVNVPEVLSEGDLQKLIDSNVIDSICDEVKDKYGFELLA